MGAQRLLVFLLDSQAGVGSQVEWLQDEGITKVMGFKDSFPSTGSL